jgi:hypothetical protein
VSLLRIGRSRGFACYKSVDASSRVCICHRTLLSLTLEYEPEKELKHSVANHLFTQVDLMLSNVGQTASRPSSIKSNPRLYAAVRHLPGRTTVPSRPTKNPVKFGRARLFLVILCLAVVGYFLDFECLLHQGDHHACVSQEQNVVCVGPCVLPDKLCPPLSCEYVVPFTLIRALPPLDILPPATSRDVQEWVFRPPLPSWLYSWPDPRRGPPAQA